jgi:hypothetical protein
VTFSALVVIGPPLPARGAETRVGSLKAKADTKDVKSMIKKNVDLQGKNVLANQNVRGQQKACLSSSLYIAYRP